MKYILLLLVGALIGAALTFYIFVGAPRMKQAQTGAPLQAPDAAGDPPGTAVLTLDEKFFDTLLSTIFRDLNAPAFRLAAMPKESQVASAAQTGGFSFVQAQEGGGGGCTNQIVVAQEGGGVRTGVSLKDGQIVAPLAFSGSREVFGNCMNFRGAADAQITLYFKPEEQTLYGQIEVRSVNLEGISPLASPFITGFVQTAINQKVNPLVLMRGAQLSLNIPVQASNGTLRAQAKDVRSEVKDGALRLHVTYDFSGARGAGGSGAPAPSQS
ncbi:MAG TPA: hypothetical protein VGX24_09710 [Pyrinomonadaceae bacterium]|jgi:hypothetical protein|nr:hypothetical protein [Pyrinomonadaceae bacterium]